MYKNINLKMNKIRLRNAKHKVGAPCSVAKEGPVQGQGLQHWSLIPTCPAVLVSYHGGWGQHGDQEEVIA